MLFIAANGILMLFGFYYLPLLPLLLITLYLAFYSLNKLFMAVVLLTPLSVELSSITSGIPFDLSLPTEPVIAFMMLLVLLRFVHAGTINREVLFHPVSLSILFYLLWLLITTFTSSMPLVSVKFFLVRFWFITVFYFLAIEIFCNKKNIRIFLWCYMLPLLVVVLYTLYRHSGYGFFSQRAAHWVVRPFYNDHTAYGAALAMFIPVLTVFAFRKKGSVLLRTSVRAALVLLLAALVFSYSRAAWLSLMAASVVWLLIRLKIRFSTLVVFSLAALLLAFMLRDDIIRKMEDNRQDSSANFSEHIRSMTNISSDASNLERINRWKAALLMFREKPLFGWGPGTYMFRYGPFQRSSDRTIISTNSADGGDAHSEYLGPLSETGLPGMVSIFILVIFSLTTGFRLLRRPLKRSDRQLVTGVLLGLITYLVHGILNNFLSSDKAAIPFFGFIAILVAMDIKTRRPDVPEKIKKSDAGCN